MDTVLINLIKSWPDKEDEIEVWLNSGHRGIHLYRNLGIKSRLINLPAFPVKPLCFLAAIIGFYGELKKAKPDIVFSHNGGYPGGKLSLAFVVAAKMVHVHQVFLAVHNYAIPYKFVTRPINQVLDCIIDHSCSGIISVSASCAAQIQKARFSRCKKIGFIYNGIIMQKTAQYSLEQKRQYLQLKKNIKVIGSIGDYEERKGHEYLIRAFARVQADFPDTKLIIIGSSSSPHTLVLKKLIEELHLEKEIILTGYLDAAWEYIECFDLFVFPSIAYESFGMVLLEAMLYKKPIIATRTGGIPEVMDDKGILVEAKDVMAMADAIKQVLNDPLFAQKMGEEGYNRLRNEFQAQRMAEKYHRLLR